MMRVIWEKRSHLASVMKQRLTRLAAVYCERINFQRNTWNDRQSKDLYYIEFVRLGQGGQLSDLSATFMHVVNHQLPRQRLFVE